MSCGLAANSLGTDLIATKLWLCQNCGCFLLEGLELREGVRCNSLKTRKSVENEIKSFPRSNDCVRRSNRKDFLLSCRFYCRW